MPTVQSIRYFQAASRSRPRRKKPTSSAVVSVVASIATHIRPRLFSSGTASIARTERWNQT